MSDTEVTNEAPETEGTPADEGDFTGTATGADGADNTDIGESVPAGDPEPESGTQANPGDGDGGPLGESFDA